MPYPISSRKPRVKLHVPLGLPSSRLILHALIVDLPFVALLVYLTMVELILEARLGLFPAFVLFMLPFVVLLSCVFYLLGVGRNLLMKLFRPSFSKSELGSRVWNRLWGWHRFFFPGSLIINNTRLDPPDHWSKWLGGPASLAVYDGFAAYLEYGNRFKAVVGAQVPLHELDPHETIKAIVDLRPQFRDFEANGWTKDGIKIILAVRVEARIGSKYSPEQADPKLLYPFDPLSVQHAVEATSVKSRDVKLVEADWCERATGKVKGLLTHHITTRRLDELFLTDRGGGQILSADMLGQLLEEANLGLKNAGIQVSNIQIIGTQIPEDVYGQRLDVWKSAKDSTVTRIHGAAQAFEIRVVEAARARAQRELILSITRGLEGMDPSQFTETTLLSLSKVLDRGLKDPLVRILLEKETIALLEELR